MNRRNTVIIAVVLIAVLSVSLFLAVNQLFKPSADKKFYVGVEFAYGSQFSQLKALVDRVKDFTNLIIIGSLPLSFNRTALDQSVDYIYHSNLSFIVFFTSYPTYNHQDGWSSNYTIFDWMQDARVKYGDKFLGVYRFDEPGGNQLDTGPSQLINKNIAQGGYDGVAKSFVGNLSGIVNYYHQYGGVQIFTSDYALYWFDYASSYDAVFAELTVNQTRFVGNQSKQEIIALNRGAAESFHKNWGAIVTWSTNSTPYLESGSELYNDLAQAYCAGATYDIIFDYPNITINGLDNPYGLLTEDHFGNMSKFWNDIQNNTFRFIPDKPEAAYVMPENYGFGFRSENDSIWGVFSPDSLTLKIWNDTQFLVEKYSYKLNIIYTEPGVVTSSTLHSYKNVYYYNKPVT